MSAIGQRSAWALGGPDWAQMRGTRRLLSSKQHNVSVYMRSILCKEQFPHNTQWASSGPAVCMLQEAANEVPYLVGTPHWQLRPRCPVS